ncbi:phosphate acetyltransferase, partial [bacterium]|nr:phosphate acetyltransferase [bacterium]
TALKLLDEEPRIAMLSFSTKGSARDASIDKINEVIAKVHEMYSEVKIDGEMQLDAAVNSRVAAKKLPDSEVAGRANVLIVPDLNSGNILYKAIEQFGGYIAAGPILQGFHKPVSDLSRGSTMEDVKLVIECMGRLLR